MRVPRCLVLVASLVMAATHTRSADANICERMRVKAEEAMGTSNMIVSLETFVRDQAITVEPFEAPKPPSSLRDQPFGDVQMQGRVIVYDEIPPQVRGVGLSRPLYFGKPAVDRAEAIATIKTLFQYGRSNRGAAHRDVGEHVLSTRGASSGFLQTTKFYDSAKRFAVKTVTRAGKTLETHYGVVLIIDPRGAQLLDLEHWVAADLPVSSLTVKNLMDNEGEVLFSTMMPPQRIVGAVLLKIERQIGIAIPKVEAVYRNPNYELPSS